VETAEKTSPESPQASPARSQNNPPICIEPDLDFIRNVARQGGETLKKCIQCGTCSATCELSPDQNPFPRKEMAWAVWGMKGRLLTDPDLWLCHQCNDCSVRCPRGARPGDVLGAIRQECIANYAVPRFLGRWVSEPQCIPLLLGIPIALLTLAMLVKDPVERLLGFSQPGGEGARLSERIVYSYSHMLPHWLLNSFFLFFSFLTLLAVVAGVARFWGAMKAADSQSPNAAGVKGLLPSLIAVLGSIFTHEKFDNCTKARSRLWSHMCVFFGFGALCVVTLWVITAQINPLIRDDFIYPFSLWSPWKVLANAGGLALLVGTLWMAFDRVINTEQNTAGAGRYADWALLVTLLTVVITGFASELLHYVRLEPHRHIAYFTHLVFVFALLIYLPYSKLAHFVYRTAALVYAERTGRNDTKRPAPAAAEKSVEQEEAHHAARDI